MIRKREHSDSFSGTGTVTIRPFKILANGERHYLPVIKNNLIVEAGRASLIDLMIGARRKKLSYIRWGKGGALVFPDGDPLNPLPVEDKDTDVKSFLLDKPLSPYKRLSPTEVEYIETLICDEVDSDVNEAAMLFEDLDSLTRPIFARITFPTVRLTIEQGTGIEIRWVFNFSKAEEVPIDYIETPIQTPPAEEPTEPAAPDTTSPAEVTNLAETHTDSDITLTWINPLDEDFSHALVRRDGTQVATDILNGTFTETITVAGTYTYLVVAVDLAGNESAGKSITVTI